MSPKGSYVEALFKGENFREWLDRDSADLTSGLIMDLHYNGLWGGGGNFRKWG